MFRRVPEFSMFRVLSAPPPNVILKTTYHYHIMSKYSDVTQLLRRYIFFGVPFKNRIPIGIVSLVMCKRGDFSEC